MLYFSPSRGVEMKKSDDWYFQELITEFYNRVQDILIERGIKWADLARLIGLSPKTLSSMRSQNVNPSWTTVRKIAKTLDVSMDELTYEHKAPELYELYWAIPREIKDIDLQGMTCNQLLTIAYVTGNGNLKSIRHREDICKEEIQERLKAIKEGNKIEANGSVYMTVLNPNFKEGVEENSDKNSEK